MTGMSDDPGGLSGRIALITGGSRGAGLATARLLAAAARDAVADAHDRAAASGRDLEASWLARDRAEVEGEALVAVAPILLAVPLGDDERLARRRREEVDRLVGGCDG